FREPRRVGVGNLKVDVPQVSALCLLASHLNLVRRDIDRYDRPTRRHLLSHPAGGIATAATKLDDAQAVAQTDAVEQRLGPRPVDLVEKAQAFPVLTAGGQDVVFREVSHRSISIPLFVSILRTPRPSTPCRAGRGEGNKACETSPYQHLHSSSKNLRI